MTEQRPSIPKGTRDFTPAEMNRRNYIFDTIRGVFRQYGYQPIETPAMENLSTLLGKYGEEGDKLLFKILNSGNFMEGVNPGTMKLNEVAMQIAEKGLRYDLTVPFARFVVQHQGEITFPFKRYQIQPVWRADRPQKGRYREFYQCDVDVIGSDSLLNEVELIQIIDEVFDKLNMPVVIKTNNRKILHGVVEYIGALDHFTDITAAIDKFEKAGLDAVVAELHENGLGSDSIDKLIPVLQLKGLLKEQFGQLSEWLRESPTGMKGIEELTTVLRYLKELQIKAKFDFDIRLARGLNYYTGAIIEVKAKDVEIGSLCGGGRYDDLTGIFGLQGVSGVGVSFGADRIYDVLDELGLFPAETAHTSKVLIINFGEKEEKYGRKLLKELHRAGINGEVYPETVKLKKQISYADKKQIPFILLIGEEEINTGLLTLKNLSTGEQVKHTLEEVVNMLSKH
ncbi:MAG: histidine--tRNA ligase [Bacteroidetes bacterium]|nr:histidine--tRNA ligase [Bacteroidota bacterium]